MAKIVVDPGHGGTATLGGSSPNNAKGPSGLLEKTVTLAIAQRMEPILVRAGHVVVLTRRADHNVGLRDRAAAAKSIAAPVFLSIHLNGLDRRVQGTETFCDSEHSSRSADLCRAVQKHLLPVTGHRDRNAGHPGGVKRQGLAVLKSARHHAKTACVLTEISFMDTSAEEARLKTPAYLDALAQGLAEGIIAYLDEGATESVASGDFEDGFAAGGGVAEAVAALPQTESVPMDRLKIGGLEQASMNDTGEFAEVDIGTGFIPGETELDLGTAESAGGGFPMNRFRTFVNGLGLRHFSAEELLFLGHSNAPGGSCAGRNSPPPESLWNNIANTAQMLDEIRHRLGAPCRINSAYRADPYNRCVGGESGSLHMRFNAIDFRCDSGTSAQWHSVAKAVRASDPKYRGGIGKYNTFVHIDTRGQDANW